MARAAKAKSDDAAEAPETFRELVGAIADPAADDAEPLTLNELIAAATADANREARHAESAALHQLSVRLGDLRLALNDARAVSTGPLADALSVIADLI